MNHHIGLKIFAIIVFIIGIILLSAVSITYTASTDPVECDEVVTLSLEADIGRFEFDIPLGHI